jgi:hypothetical protein
MMRLKRVKVQVNAIISLCIQFVPGRLRRAWERVRKCSLGARDEPGPCAASAWLSVGVGIGCRSERTIA